MERAQPVSEAIALPGVGEAIRTTEALVARCVASLSAADTGLFGPGSVSWRVFRHSSYSVSAIAALLAQAQHPVAMAAVEAHSAFRADAWRRARMTADYVFTITFGARRVAEAAAERVRRIHAGVGGTDPFTGRRYRADDPHLLLWIHCVHTEYALHGFRRFGGGLSAAEADRFVAEQVKAAELVGLDRTCVPATREALLACIASYAGELAPTPPARQFAAMLLAARMPATMRPFWALHIAGAAALLPPELVRAYGWPSWLPRGRIAAAAIRAALAAVDLGLLLFAPVRRARARLRAVAREARG
jgi:uncharacterized protein (DUF2236 family)